jgi:hypothetical protein
MMHADEEFTSLRDPLLTLDGIGLNIAATNVHVPEIERVIRTIKERNRTTVSGLPFKHYPKLLKLELIKQAITWLNMFPHDNGISTTLSPRTILTGTTADYGTHCRVPIGAYCEVHNENDPSNTEIPQTSQAIALNPTGNLQGSYRFLSLDTGKSISRRRWTELPMTDAVTARMHAIATAERNHDPNAPNFHFEWAPNTPIVDNAEPNHEQPHMPVPEGADDVPDTDDDEEEEEENEEEQEKENEEEQEDIDEIEEEQEEEGAQGAPGQQNQGSQGAPIDITLDENQGAQGAPEEPQVTTEEEAQPTTVNEDEEHTAETTTQQRYNLRGHKISYDHRYAHQFTLLNGIVPKGPTTDTKTDLQNHILAVGLVFNQMSAKAGVKRFGDKAVEAIVKECKQLDDKKVFKPRHIKDLTELERKRALRSITLVKEKKCGTIKGRTVADGRDQRDYVNRDDATSPTVSIEGLMICIAIDAKERRAVATADVEGAYLHAKMNEIVIMVFGGDMVTHMVEANPEKYGPYVHTT